MTALFIGYFVTMVATVVAVIARYFGVQAARRVLVALCVWFTYIGLMGYFGVTGNTALRPPGVVYVLFPVVAFLVFVVQRMRSSMGVRLALAVPLWVILLMQLFRVGVELFLHRLWINGVVPRMLTFEGANVDIYIGATAPLVAWISTRGRSGLKVAFAWNLLGLLALANVVTRAILTTPGPLNLIHTEVPNQMFGTLPFTLIPGFFVPLAVVLHVLAIRAICVGDFTRVTRLN